MSAFRSICKEAQEYLRRYAPRVRASVLKAVVAPSRDWAVFHARNTQQALDRLGKGPVPTRVSAPDGSMVTVSLSRLAAHAALRASMAAPATAVRVPLLIHQAARGDLSNLALAALQYRRAAGSELSEGLFLTIACSELMARLDAGALDRESAGALVGNEPMRELMAACAEWPRSALPEDHGRLPKVATPVLLISGWLDPSTPPESGEALLRDLPNARHLVVKHGSHSFNNLAGCVDEIIAAFIARGSASGLDTRCADRIALPPFALPGEK